MSWPRLGFLYPQLTSTVEVSSQRAVWRGSRHRSMIHATALHTSSAQPQEGFAQRYGTAKPEENQNDKAAQTPMSAPSSTTSKKNVSSAPADTLPEKSLARTIEKHVSSPKKKTNGGVIGNGTKKKATSRAEYTATTTSSPTTVAITNPSASSSTSKRKKGVLEDRHQAMEEIHRDPSERTRELALAAQKSTNASTANALINLGKSKGFSSAVQKAAVEAMSLSPDNRVLDEPRPPHLTPTPFAHHFDSYNLVKDLEKSGFAPNSSIVMMKAIRSLLAVNMNLAKDGLVSKSDLENETYLFRAACSELKTEILNLRRSSATKQRTQLSHLQHTHDILSQRTTAELASLRDELKGMLDDRRMATRANTMLLDSQISELNYKISVALNSDAKSDVEGLRWLLTRRAALAIAVMAVLILGSLRVRSYKLQEQEMEIRKEAERHEKARDQTAVYTIPSREMGTQTGHSSSDASASHVNHKAENVGYVSLG